MFDKHKVYPKSGNACPSSHKRAEGGINPGDGDMVTGELVASGLLCGQPSNHCAVGDAESRRKCKVAAG